MLSKLLKKIDVKFILALAFYILIFFILLQNSFSYLDPDFGWHLEVGKQSLIDKDVARADLYDYPLKGMEWVDHEWLSNIILFLLHEQFGYFFLNVLFALLIVFSFWLFNFYLKSYIQKSVPLLTLLALELVALHGMMPHLGVRLQELGVFFLIIVFWLIARFKKTKNQKQLFFFPLLFILWSNLHASFMVGLVVLWSFFFHELLGPKIKNWPLINFFKFNLELNKKEKIGLFFACLAASISALLTPYGLEYFSFLGTYAGGFYLTHIAEWFPAWSYPVQHYQLIYSALVATVILLPFLLKEKKQLGAWRLALTLLFFYMAFRSRRHFPLFFIVSFPLVLTYLFHGYESASSKILTLTKKINPFKSPYLNFFVLSVYLVSIVYIIIFTNFTNDPFHNQKFCQRYPCGILNHINNNEEIRNKTLLNDYSWGGWLIYTRPQKQIFIDGRIPQYRYGERSFMEEYFDFFNPEKVETKLAEHDVEMVIYKHTRPFKVNWLEEKIFGLNQEKINSRTNKLEEYLKSSSSWKKVYEDKVGFVYVKK